jgi:hypothetical protein
MIKKKTIQIFSNGSVLINKTVFKQFNKVKVYNKDHVTFTFNQKKFNQVSDSKNFFNFKTKYLKF